MSLFLEESGAGDLPAIAALVNRAYRGGQGWATEAGLIAGERTRPDLLAADLAAAPDARLLVTRAADGALAGCVWLEPLGGGRWQLGALTVALELQATGLGRRLLAAAEGWAAARGAATMRLTVVHVRRALVAWYGRRGYRLTGETKPWPYDDDRFGVPLHDDLRFVVLEKALS